MQITSVLTDSSVLRELGQRISQQRLAQNISQAGLAHQAGVGRRTLQRLEAGEPVELTVFIRVLRAIGLLSALDALVPAPASSPILELRRARAPRLRASQTRAATNSPESSEVWRWEDET